MWHRLHGLPFKVVNHQTIIIDDLIYIIGGSKDTNEQIFEKISVFSIAQGTIVKNLSSCVTYSWNCKSDGIVNLLDDANNPFDRHGHTVVKWKKIGILFGGFPNTLTTAVSSSEIYLFVPSNECLRNQLKFLKNSSNSNFWVLVDGVSGSIPENRDGHSADIYYDVMFVFGGLTSSVVKHFDNKLYQLNLITWQWTIIYNGDYVEPLGRDFCSLTTYNGSLYLFGGRSCDKFLGFTFDKDIYDTAVWKFDLTANKDKRWKKIHSGNGLVISSFHHRSNVSSIPSNSFKCPFPRRSHMTTVFQNELFIFGGLYQNDKYCMHLSDLWSFNVVTCQWEMLSPKTKTTLIDVWPPGLRRGSLTAVNDNCALLIGGVIIYGETYSNLYGQILANIVVISKNVVRKGNISSVSELCHSNAIDPVPILLYHDTRNEFIGSISFNNGLEIESINKMFILIKPQLSLYQKSLQVVANTYSLNQLQTDFFPKKLISDIQTKIFYEKNNEEELHSHPVDE